MPKEKITIRRVRIAANVADLRDRAPMRGDHKLIRSVLAVLMISRLAYVSADRPAYLPADLPAISPV
jgi:hypothetical protein